jgi:hypothetical protein
MVSGTLVIGSNIGLSTSDRLCLVSFFTDIMKDFTSKDNGASRTVLSLLVSAVFQTIEDVIVPDATPEIFQMLLVQQLPQLQIDALSCSLSKSSLRSDVIKAISSLMHTNQSSHWDQVPLLPLQTILNREDSLNSKNAICRSNNFELASARISLRQRMTRMTIKKID